MKNDHYVKTIVELRAEIERLRALRANALTGELSDSKIARLTKHWTRDCDNLYIQIQHPGSRRRSWLFRWRDRVTGEYRSIGLGPYPTISIDKARELALTYRTALLEGKDPRALRDDSKLDMRIARGLVKTFREVTREWFDQKIGRRKPGYRTKILNQLHKYLCDMPVERRTEDAQSEHESRKDILGDIPMEKVTLKTVLDLVRDEASLRELWSTKWPTARDVLQYVVRIFEYAVHNDYFHGTPPTWAMVLSVLPPPEDVYQKGHRPFLPYKDFPRFLRALRGYKDRSVRKTGRTTIAYAVEFIALTGVRISEVLLAQWGEIDEKTMTWNVPPEHRKGRKKTVRPIPITKSMLAVLGEMQKRRIDQSDDALIFPSDRNGKAMKTSTPAVFISSVLKWEIKITPHGFRSTLRDWMRSNTKFDDIYWRRQVDHASGFTPGVGNHLLQQQSDATDQAYGHDPLLDGRRVMMEQWDDYGSKPAPEPKTGKVLKLSDKRRTA
jgi:integrase